MDLRKCPRCNRCFPREVMEWVSDRYGIRYKLVCPECRPVVQGEISAWVFDPDAAGERLEPE